MKLVLAMIEPQKLKAAREALADIGIYNMTVSTAMGCSRNTAPIKERYRGIDQEVYLFKKIRLETVVNDEQVDAVVDAIAAGGPHADREKPRHHLRLRHPASRQGDGRTRGGDHPGEGRLAPLVRRLGRSGEPASPGVVGATEATVRLRGGSRRALEAVAARTAATSTSRGTLSTAFVGELNRL